MTEQKKMKYVQNPETLELEMDVRKEIHVSGWQIFAVVLFGLILFFLFMWVQVSVMRKDLPKTAIMRHENAEWSTRIDSMSRQMDIYDAALSMMEERDDRIYRTVYGLDVIPQSVRLSSIADDKLYASLEGTALLDVVQRLDLIEKRVYIQSKSFEDVSTLQRTAGDMASHIPAIPPLSTDKSTFRLSSVFGYRLHPVLGYSKRHNGLDFACKPGNPIYATGDGIVVKVSKQRGGYGNHVEVDHGFGYKTRYAHMSRIDVTQGQKVQRGDCLGLSGRSGLVSGPHLHYEVLYRNKYVNPALYMDLSISPEDYMAMVRKPENENVGK